MTQRENNKFIYNKIDGIYDRCCTFDGPDHFSKKGPLSPTYSERIKEICTAIFDHYSNVSKESQKILRMSLHFKINSSNNIVLLFCANMFYDKEIWMNSKNHNRYITRKKKDNQIKDLLPPSCPEDMEYNFNLNNNQTHYKPKKVLCLQCNELKIENCFVEVENHIIIMAHYKQRAEKEAFNKLVSLDTQANATALKEAQDPRNKMNWLHFSKEHVFQKNDEQNMLTSDYLKLESLIPGIFRKLKMKYSQFETEKNSKQFLLEKSYVCDRCYDSIMGLMLNVIEKKHLEIMFSNLENRTPIEPGNHVINDDIKSRFFDKYYTNFVQNNKKQKVTNLIKGLDTQYMSDRDKMVSLKKLSRTRILSQGTKRYPQSNDAILTKFDCLYGKLDPRVTSKTYFKKTAIKDLETTTKADTKPAKSQTDTYQDYKSKGMCSKNTIFRNFFKDIAVSPSNRSMNIISAQKINANAKPLYSIYNDNMPFHQKQKPQSSANLRGALINKTIKKVNHLPQKSASQTTRNTLLFQKTQTVFSANYNIEDHKKRMTTSANVRQLMTHAHRQKKPEDGECSPKKMSQTQRNFRVSKDCMLNQSDKIAQIKKNRRDMTTDCYSHICPQPMLDLGYPHLLETSKGMKDLITPIAPKENDDEFFDHLNNPDRHFFARRNQLKKREQFNDEVVGKIEENFREVPNCNFFSIFIQFF